MYYVLRIAGAANIILADFNLAVSTPTAKPPNLNPRQIFRLYGISSCVSHAGIREKRLFYSHRLGFNISLFFIFEPNATCLDVCQPSEVLMCSQRVCVI